MPLNLLIVHFPNTTFQNTIPRYISYTTGPIGRSYNGYADTGSLVVPFHAHLISEP
jgi:hypothetical protein